MTYNLHSFCPEAWSQIEINNQGNYKICCLANYDDGSGYALDENGVQMSILTHTIDEAMNSETHKLHRLELSQNIRPTRCRNCYDSEDADSNTNKRGTSKRQRLLNVTAPAISEYVTVDNAATVTGPDGTIKPLVVNLDLRFGNLCNYKCIMCTPEFSNQWYQDWVDIKPTNTFATQQYIIFKDQHGRYRSNAPNWWETPQWEKQWNDIEKQVRYIYFAGAEPMLVPEHDRILDRLIEIGHAGKVRLRYDTNLSVINKNLLEKLKHFKKVFMCVSIDDTGDRYNLIRFPGNYDRFIENLQMLKDSGISIHHISSCIGLASVYSMFRVDEVAKQFNVSPEYRYLELPAYWDIRNLPKSAKLELIEEYTKSLSGPGDHNSNHKGARQTINLLTKYIDQHNPKLIQEFVRVMNILSRNRGNDWRQVLPDTYALLKKHCTYLDFDKIDNPKYNDSK